jgi:hypothetical protein
LARHDPEGRPCKGRAEIFHFIGRQRVRDALYYQHPEGDHLRPLLRPSEWLELAEWDPRNGGIACEGHHRRFDNHLTPSLVVPADALPVHVIEFAEDWGLEAELERKFPARPTREEAA